MNEQMARALKLITSAAPAKWAMLVSYTREMAIVNIFFLVVLAVVFVFGARKVSSFAKVVKDSSDAALLRAGAWLLMASAVIAIVAGLFYNVPSIVNPQASAIYSLMSSSN